MAETLERDINIKVNTYGIDGAEKKIGNLSKKFTEQQKKVDDLNKKYQELSATMEEIYDEYQNTGDDSLLEDFNKVSQELDGVTSKLNDAKLGLVDIGNQFGELGDQLQNQFQGGVFNVLENGFSASSITSLMKMLGASAPEIAAVAASLAVIVKFLDELNQAVDEVTGAYKAAGKAAAGFVGDLALGNIEVVVDTIQLLSDGLHEVTDACAEAVNELQEFADLGKEVQDSYFNIYTYLGPKLGSNLIEYTNTMSLLYNMDNKKQLENLRGILAATTQLGLKKDDLLKYTKAFQSFTNDLAVFSGEDISAVASQLENAINMNVLNSRSAVAKALDLNDSDIKNFKALNTQLERANFLLSKGAVVAGLHARYMETDAGKVEQLKNAWENFYNTVGKLALQLWARIAPILTQLLNFATKALNALAKLFNFNLESPIANNSENIAGKYNEIGDAIEETGDKAKDASRKVASFDDVIQINEDKSSSNKVDTSGLGLEGYDPSAWIEDFDKDVEDTIFDVNKLKDYIQELLDKFKAWEEGLDWKAIRENARLFGETLADIANTFIDDEQFWIDMGDLVGNGINSVAELLDGFVTKIHWSQLGKSLRLGITQLFESLDEDLIGTTLYDTLIGIVKFAGELFADGGVFTPMADSLSKIIIKFVNLMSTPEAYESIGKFVTNFITDIVNAINKAIDNFDTNNTSQKLASIFRNIFKRLGDKLPDIIETFSRLLVSELNLIGDVISASIEGLFEGLDSDPQAIDTIINSILGIATAVFENIGKIGEELYKHKDKIVEFIKKFIDGILDFVINHSEDLVPLTDTLIAIIRSIDIVKLHAAIITFIDKSGITQLIAEVAMKKMQIDFFAFFEKVHLVINSLLKLIGDALGALFTAIIMALIGLFKGISDLVGTIVNTIGEFIVAVFDLIVMKAEEFFKWYTGQFDGFGEAVHDFFEMLGEDISKWLSDTWSSITKSFDDAINWFSDLFEYLGRDIKVVIDNIKKWFDDLKNSVLGVFGGIIDKFKEARDALGNFIKEKADAIKNFGDNLFGGFNIGIPHMAIGGIVQQSTVANIGEDGAEAVLPLEKNTGWMDVLASKMASRMNTQGGNGSSGSITVNVGNKGFYTRSEMIDMAEQIVSALRVYGVNVSVAY